MNTMTYKSYTARIDFDDRDNIFVGRLLGIRDIVGFHADNVTDLRAAFEEAADDYLEACKEIGKSPEKPASGKLAPVCHQRFSGGAGSCAQAAGKALTTRPQMCWA